MKSSEGHNSTANFLDTDFRKSLHSNHTWVHACVAVAIKDGFVGVRDTKDAASPTLTFTTPEWRAFILGVRDGEFDV